MTDDFTDPSIFFRNELSRHSLVTLSIRRESIKQGYFFLNFLGLVAGNHTGCLLLNISSCSVFMMAWGLCLNLEVSRVSIAFFQQRQMFPT